MVSLRLHLFLNMEGSVETILKDGSFPLSQLSYLTPSSSSKCLQSFLARVVSHCDPCLFSTNLTAVYFSIDHLRPLTLSLYPNTLCDNHIRRLIRSQHMYVSSITFECEGKIFMDNTFPVSSNAFISGSQISDVVAPSYCLFMWPPGSSGMVRTSVVKY